VDDELCGRLRAAAFHGGLAGPELLARGVAGPPLARWLTAVVLGAQGRYAAAYALLEPLSAQPGPVLSSLACSTLGSHRRQLGGHAAARRWDSAALRRAAVAMRAEGPLHRDQRTQGGLQRIAHRDPDGIDPPGALADALLGLAADALAVGRLAEARALVDRVEATGPQPAASEPPAVQPAASWRSAVRHAWVSAELALAAGEPAAARAPAEAAGALARSAEADRHAVKSDIVLAVVLATGAVELARAEQLLTAALQAATKHGWHSLCWPAAFAGAQFDQNLREYGGAMLHRVLRASDPAGREIAAGSPWVPTSPGSPA
jgi:hypothetical protein